MKKGTKAIGVATAVLLMGTSAVADGDIVPNELTVKVKADKPKRQTMGNMTVKYSVLPGNIGSIGGMFTEGIFYGRLRSNTFYWDWDIESAKKQDNKAWGLGGSLIYKSAVYNGIGFTLGYYGTMNPDFFRMDADEVGFVKAGKDTFNRYKVKTGGGFGMHALGQGFLEYNNRIVGVKAGRQLFESVFTASNDTKMIPNTFDGVSVGIKIASKTKIRAAWFGKQKLRNHENAHDVLTFKDKSGESWNNNDDSAVHKGLSYANFVAAGEDPSRNLFLADLQTKYVKNLNFKLSALSVPGVVKDIVVEAHYEIPFENGWVLRPGARYFYQMDDGGGAVAGYTNLTGKAATGYDAGVANSLESSLFAARIDLQMLKKKGFFRLGYSEVADKADILAPWRGFPTGGFTRAMAQYNWYANTKTYMIRAVYKFTPDFKASLRYAVQDFDDTKVNVQADSTIWHLDTWYNFAKNFQMKTRVGIVNADPGSTGKADVSYNEYRLEFNYLF